MDLTDLFLTPVVVTLFNQSINSRKVAEYFSLTIFTAINRNEPKGPFIPLQLKLKIKRFLTVLVKNSTFLTSN